MIPKRHYVPFKNFVKDLPGVKSTTDKEYSFTENIELIDKWADKNNLELFQIWKEDDGYTVFIFNEVPVSIPWLGIGPTKGVI